MTTKPANDVARLQVEDIGAILKRTIGDRDPSVMTAGLCGLVDVAKTDPVAYANLVPSLVSILKQCRDAWTASRWNRKPTCYRLSARF
eukprot:919440-Rhodomonas_salina.1